MDSIGEDLEELEQALKELVRDPTLPASEALRCVFSVAEALGGTDPFPASFPWDALLGPQGCFRHIKPLAGIKDYGPLMQNIMRLFISIIEKHPEKFKEKFSELEALSKVLYFVNTAAVARVEGLRLISAALYLAKNQNIEEVDVHSLVYTYFTEYAKTCKLTSTVESQLNQTLGKFCQHFPTSIDDIPKRLADEFISKLKAATDSRTKLDLTVVEGTLKGLDYIIAGLGLAVFYEDDMLDLESFEKFYKLIQVLCRLPSIEAEVSRRGAMRASLELFCNHSLIFRKIILNDSVAWLHELQRWATSRNQDDHKVGWRALRALLKTVSHGLEELEYDLGNEDQIPRVLREFLDYFNRTIRNNKSDAESVSLCIDGYGYFCRPLHRFFSDDEYSNLCIDVLGHTEQFHIESSPADQEKWIKYFPHHLESVAKLLSELTCPPLNLVFSLEALCIHLVKRFPTLRSNFQFSAVSALLKVFESCPVGDLVYNVVYQTVVETCSHPVVAMDQELASETVTYRTYIPLWDGLMKESANNPSRSKLFQAFIDTFVGIIEKLDLTVIPEGEEEEPPQEVEESMSMTLTQSENGPSKSFALLKDMAALSGKKASVVKDYTILVNLVDITVQVLNKCKDLVSPWLPQLWRQLSKWSYEHSDASAFYKLAGQLLEVSCCAQLETRSQLSTVIFQFLEDHLLKASLFNQAELRMTSYRLITKIPLEFVPKLVHLLPKVYDQIFQLAVKVPELANDALSVVDMYIDKFSQKSLDELIKTVVPNLRVYLSYRSKGAGDVDVKKTRVGPVNVRRQKKKTNLVVNRNFEEENCNLALNILMKVCEEYKRLVLPSEAEVGESLTVWDTTKHLKLDVQLNDCTISLEIDNLLPPVLDIVETSGDRQQRAAAAEVLHSTLLMMIGKTSTRTEEMSEKLPMTEIFKRVLPTILNLASDPDSVVQGLFRPLFSQMIHWFTKTGRTTTPYTTLLLETLIDNICDNKEMSLKFDAASFLAEFLTWAIKQSGTSTVNLVVNRLYNLWRHPDVDKRMGSCLAFNSVYRILREDENSMEKYILVLLVSVFTSLKISHTDPIYCETSTKCVENLNHLKRILLSSTYLSALGSDSNTRRTPAEMSGNTMSSLLEYLLELIVAPQGGAHQLAMEFFHALVSRTGTQPREAILSKFGSFQDFLNKLEARICKIEEPSLQGGFLSVEIAKDFQAFYETYFWLIDTGISDWEELTEMPGLKIKSITNMLIKGTAGGLIFHQRESDSNLSASQQMFIETENSKVIPRLYLFLTSVFKAHPTTTLLNTVRENTSFCDLLIGSIMAPTKYGLKFKSAQEESQFERCYVDLLTAIKASSPEFLKKIKQYFYHLYLTNTDFAMTPLCLLEKIMTGSGLSNIHILKTYYTLARRGTLIEELDCKELLDHLMSKLPDKLVDLNNLPPVVKEHLGTFVNLIFSKNNDEVAKEVVEIILSNNPKHNWFVDTFYKACGQPILLNVRTLLMRNIDTSGDRDVHNIIQTCVKILSEVSDERAASSLLDCVLENWIKLRGSIDSRTDVMRTVYLVRSLAKVCNFKNNKCNIIVSWFCCILKNSNVDLKLKSKCLPILGNIIEIPSDENIREALLAMSSHFPVVSSELDDDSSEGKLYKSIFRQVLKTLETTKSTTLLHFIISIACREKNHICEQEIQASITKVITGSSQAQQMDLVNVPFNIYLDKEGMYSSPVRLAAVIRFVVPAIQSCSAQNVRTFFQNHLEELIVMTGCKIAGNLESRSSSLTSKIGAMELFGVLYVKVDKNMIHAPGGLICSPVLNILRKHNLTPDKPTQPGKELTAFLIDGKFKSLGDPNSDNKSLKDLYMQYHRTRLNCVSSVTCCVAENEKAFNAIIFTENLAKGELVWSRIVDLDADINLRLVQEKDFLKKNHLVTVRQSVLSEFSQDVSFQSHYLSDSSLSQDISHYDYTASLSQAVNHDTTDDATTATDPNSYVEIEEDEISNPCLPQLIAVAELISSKNLYIAPTENYKTSKLPNWMGSVLKVLSDCKSHRNVKLFLLKLIYSCPNIFLPFCCHFYEPILQCIADGTLSPKGDLNYMIHDILILLFSWSEETGTIPPKDLTVSKVLTMLMKNSYSDQPRIFKKNVKFVSKVLELWRERCILEANFEVIEGLLVPSEGERSHTIGLTLITQFLSFQFFDQATLEKSTVSKNIVKTFNSTHKDVYRPAGVASGLYLASLPADSSVTKTFLDALKKLSEGNTSEQKKRFILVLHGIQSEYPKILSTYASHFKYSLKNMNDDDLSICFEMLQTHAIELKLDAAALPVELNMIDLKLFLTRKDPHIQTLALKVLYLCIEKLNSVKAMEYIEIVEGLAGSRFKDLKRGSLELFQECYSKPQDAEIKVVCLRNIMYGLSDTDESLRTKCSDFINQTVLSSTDSFLRMKEILEVMHFEEHEDRVLSFLPISILALAEPLKSYNEQVFIEPLDQCNFVEYNVDTSWRMQHSASLMPLYADSLNSQSQGDSQRSGMLKATLTTLAFSQTQGGQTLTTSADSAPAGSGTPQAGVRTKPRIIVGNLEAGKHFTQEQTSKEHQRSTFSKRAEQDKKRKKQVEEDKLKSNKRNVTLMRKYRKGDLPDIQITKADLVKPIVNLGHHSKEISKVLFYNIMRNLFDSNETQILLDDSIDDMGMIFNTIFETTNGSSPDLVSSLLQLCTHFSPIKTLKTEKITEICTAPGLEYAGILMLEKYLTCIKGETHANSSKKRKLEEMEGKDVELCINLADLYRHAGEQENVKGVFFQNRGEMNIHKDTAIALNYETTGEWASARRVYEGLYNNEQLVEHHRSQEIVIWNKGFYESYMKLGEWDKLSSTINQNYPCLSDVWKSSQKDSIIPALMASSMHLDAQDNKNDIYSFLNDCRLVKEKMDYLKRHSSLQLSQLFGAKGHYSDGLKICKKAKESLRLQIFAHKQVSTGNEESKLLQLQALHELEHILSTLNTDQHYYTEKLWEENTPGLKTQLDAWDNILSIRELLVNKTEGMGVVGADQSPSKMKRLLGQCYVSLGESSAEQINLPLTKRSLLKLKPFMGNDEELKRKRISIVTKVHVVNYYSKRKSEMTAVDNFCKIFKCANKAKEFDFIAHECLFDIAEQNQDVKPSVLRKHFIAEKDISAFERHLKEDTNQSLRETLQKECVDLYTTILEENVKCNDKSQILLEGANFIHRVIAAKLQGDQDVMLWELCVELHLKSMELGSLKSRELFPRILNLVLSNKNIRDPFRKLCQSVPAWMFLPWRDQLISCLHDKDVVKCVYPIVKRIADEYPTSVLYALKSGAEDESIPGETKDILRNLFSKMEFSSIHQNFLFNLSLLTMPHVALGVLISTWENISGRYKDWKQRVAHENTEFEKKFLPKLPRIESIFKSFAKDFGKDILACFKSYDLAKLKSVRDQASRKKKLSKQLNDFSAYLANYPSCNTDDHVEIPGQFRGFSRPDPARHITISNFESHVNIFSSKQFPIELRMIGSDGKRHRFIVKAGEDLRLDQRIENLFEICNICLSHDASSCNKDLKIKTYSVIPLTKSLGLIEFVPHTETLGSFLKGDGRREIDEAAKKSFEEGIEKLTKIKSNTYLAFRAGGKLSSEDVIRNYKRASSLTDSSHLRNAVFNLSSSPTGFYNLRKKFVSSYAVLSVMQWILGIGDRHSSNYLVCQKTGRVITIDFGYSFGTATSSLPIPELVQLRLTPQLIGLFEPLGTNGLFREMMILALSCLRARPEILVSALDTFVQEPTLDWTRSAFKENKEQKINAGESEAGSELARRRVAIARSKLDGGNPSELCIQDLRLGGEERPHFKNLEAAVAGTRLNRPTAKQAGLWGAEGSLTASEQVDCLIHQSTDPNLLGRMWLGWAPYL